MGCGSSLVQGQVCGQCQTLLPLQARYCFHCGAFVAAAGFNPVAAQPVAGMQPVSGVVRVPVTEGQSQGGMIQPGGGITLPVAPAPQVVSPAPQDISPADPNLQIGKLIPARPVDSMLPSLKNYLPAHLYEPLERKPKERDIEAVRDHLSALIGTAKTYLAYPVIASPQPPGIPAGGMYRGVFLFGDVSGFTPLSEKLKALGQAGAEQITSIINALFTQLTTVLFDHGGTLLKFGGDAMLGLFPATTDEEMKRSALRAAQAALVMQEVMKRPEFAEINALGEKRALLIKIGISAGSYFAAHIGTFPSDYDPNGTMAFVTTGETVNLAEESEGHAHPGQVAMTMAVARLLDGVAELGAVEKEPDENYRRLVSVPPLEAGAQERLDIPEPPAGDTLSQITYLVARLDRLTPYLSDELIRRIVENPRNARITPEHRPVTVMFANYKGISRLIEKHGESDPELITHHLNNYFVHMASIVERYEGTLARMDQYAVGDRLVIFFGAPRAHEDDPVRAVYTALEMQAAVKANFAALRTSTGVYRFEQRVGINTGHLFAGNAGAPDLRQEYTLMGDDINMAARLMSNAPWGDIYISRKTRDYVAPYVDVTDRGELKVKGKEIRIPTFSVTGRKDQVGRTRGTASGESPLTGRDAVLAKLVERGETFLKKRGQIVALMGNSGMGKSRLLREFHSWLDAHSEAGSIEWIEARALSFSEQTTYWMAAQVMRGLLHLKADSSQDDVLYALGEAGERLLGDDAMDAVPYLAHMMGLELGQEWEWVKKEDPKVRQKQILWAASRFFSQAATEKPIVLALDDLHWADEASLSLFEHLLKLSDQVPLMFFLIFRALRDKGCWRLRDRASSDFPHRFFEVELQPLKLEESASLLSRLLPGASFKAEIQADILNKAAGNPFYLEEVVNTLIENQAVIPEPANPGQWLVTDKITQISVPASLHAAIVARIDRLTEDARLALQMAAVIGRQFRMELLRDLSHAQQEIGLWVAQLERGGLVRPADIEMVDATYTFPESLVQEVAYDSVLVQNRQQMHQRIGEMLEEVYQENPEPYCELLAFHFGNSADDERALKYLGMAAKKAEGQYANATAIQFYSKILQIQRIRGDKAAQAGTLYTVGVKAYEIGDYDHAAEWLEESAKSLVELGNPASEGWSVMYLGMVALKRAHYSEALSRHNHALALSRARNDRFQEGIHLTNLARVLLRMGQYDRAMNLFNESLTLKRANNDIPGQGFAHFYMGLIHIYTGQLDNAEKSLNDSVEMWQQTAQNQRGLAYCYQGLGLLALARQDFASAEEYLQKAVNICEKLVLKAEAIENYSHLSQALLGLGQKQPALEKSSLAIKLLEAQKDVEEVQHITFNHYRVLKTLDDPYADNFLQRAHETMLAQAELIEDPAEREIFIKQVVINQKISESIG
jgi:class 3 adenylate cyclase/tetratricopeptide (TPR) repeat protein